MGNTKMKFVKITPKVLSIIFIAIISLSLAKRTKRSKMLPKTCENYKLNGETLTADCKIAGAMSMVDKGTMRTSVNLSKCVGNIEGKLKAGSGGYERSCSGCKLTKDTFGSYNLACKCKTSRGATKDTTLYVSFMTSKDGKFNNCGTATGEIIRRPQIVNQKMERNPSQ